MSQPRVFGLAVGAALLSVAVALVAQSASVVTLPPAPMQEKATTACTECHDAHIIVQQRLSKAAWTKEVDKMIRWGAVVDVQDHDSLIEYLSANFGTDRAPYQPDRTSSQPPAKH